MPASRRLVGPLSLTLATTGLASVALSSGAVAATARTDWHAMAASPLSAREYATSVWTGKEVLVFGGDRYPCAPNAKCVAPTDPPLADGAAYNPATNKWRTIAPAPLPVPRASAARVGGSVYALIDPDYNLQTFAVQHQTFASYSIAKNKWTVLPRPDAGTANLVLAAVGDKVVAYRSPKETAADRDLVWDAGRRAWRLLPADPTGPFDGRVLTSVNSEAVVLGTKPGVPAAAEESVQVIASRLDLNAGRWTHLRPSAVAADAPQWWSAAGSAVNATPGTTAKGHLALGGILDPAGRGRWKALPARPGGLSHPTVGFEWAQAGGGDWVVAGRYALNAHTLAWRKIDALPELRGYLQGPSVTWAGDRLFVWGGAMFNDVAPKGLRNAGWTWTPAKTRR
jgi:hypothetical protein